VRLTHSTTRVTTYACYTFCCHNTGNDLQDFKFSVFLNNSVTLTRYILPDDDPLRSKHVGVFLSIFMYFNIEIRILD